MSLGKTESLPLETLLVAREIVGQVAKRVGAKNIHYATQHSKSLAMTSSSTSYVATSIIYQMDIGDPKTFWSLQNSRILLEFDVTEGFVYCGRASEREHELWASHAIHTNLGDPDLIDKIATYIEITTEIMNPKPPELSIKDMVIKAFKRWIQ
jgi:hypothetical protein